MTRRNLLARVGTLLASVGLTGIATAMPKETSNMSIHINQDSPDTCPCSYKYAWDDEAPGEVVYTLVEVVNRCEFHQAVVDQSFISTVVGENQRKNIAVYIICQYYVEFGLGNSHLAELPDWQFTFGRTLQLYWPNSNVSQAFKTAIQEDCDERFGLGKVEVL